MNHMKSALAIAAMTAMMYSGASRPDRDDTVPKVGDSAPRRELQPWNRFELSKSERRGKTPEEVQALRKARWEEAHDKGKGE